MITYYSNKQYDDETQMIEIACKSTDTKPTTGVASGSLALEVNTGKMYAFDGENWNELS